MFGVGRNDETILTAGITHVVEHLALQALGTKPYPINGAVGPVSTRFSVIADPDGVVEFFGSLAATLRDLPLERLSDELRVLQVEQERRGWSQLGLDLSVRFGPHGPGLLGWPEHGLRRLTPEEVTEWARAWFTARNAVLWLSGPTPRGLSLAKLRRGRPQRRSDATPLALPARSWTPAGTRTVSLSLVSGLEWGVPTAMALARQRAFERLRTDQGLSYAVEFTHVRLGGGRALEYLSADGAAGSYDKILNGLSEVLEDLATSGPRPAELDYARQARLQMSGLPQATLAHLDNTAERRLLGMPLLTIAEADERLSAQTPSEVRDELASVCSSLLGVGPKELGEKLEGWSTVSNWSSERVEGKPYEPIGGRERGTLVIGPAGLSWAADEARARTVSWSDAVACFAWDNGMRTILGPTGTSVVVTPWNWRGGSSLTAQVDAAIDPGRVIRLGEGSTVYRRNPSDAESIAHVRWLGSIVGAKEGRSRVDIVVDSDAVMILHAHHTAGSIPSRLRELRSSDRQVLLAAERTNRRIAAEDIEKVVLSTAAGAVNGWVVIHDRHGRKITIDLGSQDQVKIATDSFSNLLGNRFTKRSSSLPRIDWAWLGFALAVSICILAVAIGVLAGVFGGSGSTPMISIGAVGALTLVRLVGTRRRRTGWRS